MRFLSTAHSDVGTSKKVNQDAFALKIARTSRNAVALAILCDGMGGLQYGELASAFVVNTFSRWFEQELPPMLNSFSLDRVKERWNSLILEQGEKIMNYGKIRGGSLGTTLTALLIVDDQYIFAQVGDSRLYRLHSGIRQLSKDQTLVTYEVEHHRLTEEAAKTDDRKNVLLQCIGATKTIVPEFGSGKVKENDLFLLCSDGFRHEISSEEIYGVLAPNLMTSEKVMKRSLMDLVELNKTRQEKDNITALLVKPIR